MNHDIFAQLVLELQAFCDLEPTRNVEWEFVGNVIYFAREKGMNNRGLQCRFQHFDETISRSESARANYWFVTVFRHAQCIVGFSQTCLALYKYSSPSTSRPQSSGEIKNYIIFSNNAVGSFTNCHAT
jgi:hypothetical protein